MLYTTLNKVRRQSPCAGGWEKLLKDLGKTKADDEPLPFETILDALCFDDAIWCARSTPEYARQWRLLAVWYARQARQLMPEYSVVASLGVAERYAKGDASDEELAECWEEAAGEVAREKTNEPARLALQAVVWATAAEAGGAVISAAWAAAAAVRLSSGWVVWEALRDAQREEFLRTVRGEGK